MKNRKGIPQYSIDGMLAVVEHHFQNTFSGHDMREDVAEMFLNEMHPENNLLNLAENAELLTRLIELVELEDVLKLMLKNKSPGPDGLSYEFYKKILSDEFLKKELLNIMNSILITAKTKGKLPAKLVEGVITLALKREPEDCIENYRAITLTNTDMKIFSKILSLRLKPYLADVLHESQFAQPGLDINMLNVQIRDLLFDLQNDEDNDAFFVSLDFKAAFDKVKHVFLYRVLERSGFPTCFINVVKALYANAKSIIYVNGYKSKKINIDCGIRQGCNFSRDLFTLALNPLICFLNNNSMIQKYKSVSTAEYLTLCYTDDCNFVTSSLSSLLNCFYYIEKYGEAAGLELNLGKSKGVFFNKKNVLDVEHLPGIQWVSRLKILGIHYGPTAYVNTQWMSKLKELKEEISFFQKAHRNTLQDKAILSKSKLLPIISYMGNVHSIPNNIVKQIDCILLKFIVSHDKTLMELHDFAAGKTKGGYCIDHITLHTTIFLLKPIFEYVKCKISGETLPKYLYSVEYQIGVQLCNVLNLSVCNALPHAVQPNNIYSICLDVFTR